jgi:hypothetical protein
MPSLVSAYCGLYCGSCARFLETARRPAGAVAAPGQEPCLGCRSDVNSPWCAQCNLKRCARGKGVEFCGECAEYPCADLRAFRDDPRFPYHAEVGDHLRTIAEHGEAEWLRRMERKWTCPTCGAKADWYSRSCPRCAGPMPGFSRPAAGA